jgi:oxygen-independent coproporphyrinogen-3 oxidase
MNDPLRLTSLPPLSLYIHLPWCARKCPYCDFNSHEAMGDLPEAAYVNRLLEDLEQDLVFVQSRALESIFIGGGTPSLFSPSALDNLLVRAKSMVAFADDIEITMEANPGSAEAGRFRELHALGINRLSIGVQSFQDKHLNTIGRVHSAREARAAIESAISAGFSNINIDLMHGLPNQDVKSALYDIEIAKDFQTTHLSWYQMTIEPNTHFYNNPPKLPDDESLWQIQEQGYQQLADSFTQYEVSAFSLPGKESRHNSNYWQFGDYLGVGAGAHGKVTLLDEFLVKRTRKTRLPTHYLDPSRTSFGDRLDVDQNDLPLEFLMNCLRLKSGVAESLFQERTGLPITQIASFLERNRRNGRLVNSNRLQTTELGFWHLNALLADVEV